MARTITPGRTWRDLPPSPPVGEPAREAVPPPEPPPAGPPPGPSGRGWWAALALALAAALAVGAVWLWAGGDDESEIVGRAEIPRDVPEPALPGDRLDEFFEQFDDGDVPDALDRLRGLPQDLQDLLPPGFAEDLRRFFDEGRLPDDFPLDPFGELPPDLLDEFRQFFDGRDLPQLDEFFEGRRDFFFRFGDGGFGVGYLPEGYRIAGSSHSSSVEGGEVRTQIEMTLSGPQGDVIIRARTGGDAAGDLADLPGDPVDVRGGEGKLDDSGEDTVLSFAAGDALVTVAAGGDLPSEELLRIAEGLELHR